MSRILSISQPCFFNFFFTSYYCSYPSFFNPTTVNILFCGAFYYFEFLEFLLIIVKSFTPDPLQCNLKSCPSLFEYKPPVALQSMPLEANADHYLYLEVDARKGKRPKEERTTRKWTCTIHVPNRATASLTNCFRLFFVISAYDLCFYHMSKLTLII